MTAKENDMIRGRIGKMFLQAILRKEREMWNRQRYRIMTNGSGLYNLAIPCDDGAWRLVDRAGSVGNDGYIATMFFESELDAEEHARVLFGTSAIRERELRVA